MGRPRSVPDDEVFAAILGLLAEDGAGAVSFGTVSKVCGLAPPTLVQRYGDRAGMLRAALAQGWDGVMEAGERIAATEETAQGYLKALSGVLPRGLIMASLADPEAAARAAEWRQSVERVLTAKQGCRGEAAAMLFAAWQGRLIWDVAGGAGFKLKDAARRLG
ncbi:MAG: transcriptional regulator [Rhodobacter sp.]|nr:transcriptional regulator [Rhodobacter sp.]